MEVTLEDFITTDIEAPIRKERILDCMDMGGYYKEAALKADRKGKVAEARVFNLLDTVLRRLYLSVREPNNPFSTSNCHEDLKGILDELKGKQATVISTILPSIENPSLRARLAEIVLVSDKRNEGMARRAISSYCEAIEFSLDKKACFSLGDEWDEKYMICETLRRACHLSCRIGWKGGEAALVKAILLDLYQDAYGGQDPNMFNEVGRIALDFSLVRADKIARDSEFLSGSVKEALEEISWLAEDAKKKSDGESEK